MSTWYPEADLVIQHPKIYTVAITCDEVKEGKTDFPIIEDGGVAAKDGKVIAANMWGKVKTVLQMLSIIFYFFGTALSYRGTVDSVSIVVVVSIALCWLVAAVTAISGIKYLWDNRSFINTAK